MEYIQNTIIAFGYIGIFITIFAESGFLLGFFLPGDSLLFTVGLLASTQNLFNIHILLLGCMIAAILGDNFGYYLGSKIGPALFKKEDSLIFKKKYLVETQNFYAKYGKKTIILARFVPIVRTFAPIIAGVGRMEYRTFLAYNVIGGIIWTASFLFAGFFLGKFFPWLGSYIEYVIIVIIIISVLPVVRELLRGKKL